MYKLRGGHLPSQLGSLNLLKLRCWQIFCYRWFKDIFRMRKLRLRSILGCCCCECVHELLRGPLSGNRGCHFLFKLPCWQVLITHRDGLLELCCGEVHRGL